MAKKQIKEVEVQEEVVVETEGLSKEQALELTLSQIEKQYGKGSIMTLGSHNDKEPAMHISSGSLKFDIALGKGGYVFGRAYEMYGLPGAGKSTAFLEAIARAQSFNLTCAFIDREQGIDPDYAKKLGVDINKLLISQPESGEEAFSVAENLVASKAVDLIVLDSLATCTPKADKEKNYEDNSKMAGRAGLITRFFDRNLHTIAMNKVLFLCTNQVRANMTGYGNPESTGGGWSSKHSVSCRISIRPEKKIVTKNGEIIGNTVIVETVKNRMAAPYKKTSFDIIFGQGIDKVSDIFSIASEIGVVENKGAWYYYGDEKMQGIEKVRATMAEKPEILEEIRKKVIEVIGSEWGPEGKR